MWSSIDTAQSYTFVLVETKNIYLAIIQPIFIYAILWNINYFHHGIGITQTLKIANTGTKSKCCWCKILKTFATLAKHKGNKESFLLPQTSHHDEEFQNFKNRKQN